MEANTDPDTDQQQPGCIKELPLRQEMGIRPDPSVKGTDPQIRIRTKISRIPNIAEKKKHPLPALWSRR